MFTEDQAKMVKALSLISKREGNILGIFQGVFLSLTIIGLATFVYGRMDLESDLAIMQTLEADDTVARLKADMDSWGLDLNEQSQ